MNQFFKSILAIVLLFVILFLTSLLLEIDFINRLIVRQILIYLLMLIQSFVFFKYIYLINSRK